MVKSNDIPFLKIDTSRWYFMYVETGSEAT